MTTGREPRVAIIGATGTVGSQITDLIGEREFPCAELKLFATEAGSFDSVEAGGAKHSVSRMSAASDLAAFDIAFLAVPEARAIEIIDEWPGPVLIDLSAANRAPGKAPLVAPGLVSRERVQELKAHKLFATAHPAAQVIATVLSALGHGAGFAGATVITGASAGGRERVSDLFNQTADLLNARLNIADNEAQLAFNLFMPPRGGEISDAIAAQVAMLVAGAPAVAVQLVQAPVFHGGAVAISVPAAASSAPDEWIARMRAAPGILFIEGDDPAGFVDAVGQEAVIVRMKRNAAGAVFWCVFDSARVAAVSALWIAESLWFTFS